MMPRLSRLLVLLLGVVPGLSAQTTHSGAGPRPRLEGKWQAKTEDEIRHIMVRTHSSAQFGHQGARWRVVGDSLLLTLGGRAWQGRPTRADAGEADPFGGGAPETVHPP